MLWVTLKSIRRYPSRLLICAAGVALGVLLACAAFAFTEATGRAVEAAVASRIADYHLLVTAEGDSGRPDTGIPATALDRIRQVGGVATADGEIVVTNSVEIIGGNGRRLASRSGQYVGNWMSGRGSFRLNRGRPPRSDNEVLVNARLAKEGTLEVGRTLALRSERTTVDPLTVVGIVTCGDGRDSCRGEYAVLLTDLVAQRLAFGRPDRYGSIQVVAAPGVPVPRLAADLRAALGGGFDIRTPREQSVRAASELRRRLDAVRNVLLGLAGVVLLIAVAWTRRTFSTIVAREARAFALLRLLGAGHRQVVASLSVVALAVGLLGSAVGLAVGSGLGYLAAVWFGRRSQLPAVDFAVPGVSVVVAFAAGVALALVAVARPAIRAGRIPLTTVAIPLTTVAGTSDGPATGPGRRARRSLRRNPFLQVVVGILGTLVLGQLVAALAGSVLGTGAAGTVVASLLGVAAAFGGYYLLLVRLMEGRRTVAELRPGGGAVEWLAGFGLGAALMLLVVGVIAIVGAVSGAGGVRMSSGVGVPAAVAAGFPAAVVPGFVEELAFRGALFRISERSLGTWSAIALSSALFGFAHQLKAGATVYTSLAIALEAAVLLGAVYLVTRRLWACAGVHLGWNLVQSYLGMPGSEVSPAGFRTTVLHGPSLLTGGAYGAEESLVSVLVLIAVAVALLWYARRRGGFVLAPRAPAG